MGIILQFIDNISFKGMIVLSILCGVTVYLGLKRSVFSRASLYSSLGGVLAGIVVISLLVFNRINYFHYDSVKFLPLIAKSQNSSQEDLVLQKIKFCRWMGIERQCTLPSADRMFTLFLDSFQSMDFFEQRLEELNKAKHEAVHSIPYRDLVQIREIRRLPFLYRKYIKESAKRHNIPAYVLVNSIIRADIDKENFTVKDGIFILERRNVLKPSQANLLLAKLPLFITNIKLSHTVSSYLAAAIGGKSRMGMTGMRPLWVRESHGFDYFGINTEILTDSSVAKLLLKPQYNIEATSAVFRQNLNWVELVRKAALSNTKIDFKRFDLEAKNERNKIIEDPEAAKLIPSVLLLKDNEWIQLAFHERFGWSTKAFNRYTPWTEKSTFLLQTYSPVLPFFILIVQSGVIDDKPGRIVGATREQLERLLDDQDPYLRNAARNSL